ncbi:MAG TPA: phage tail protein [Leucothrix mucor]|nr:phage tail protein [Leucothrix mucor]
MAKFALACEGITDQIVIENILCGFYKDNNLDEDISPLQPPYDATTQKQKEGEFGGWEMLLEYLSEKRFRDDVVNNEYVIIQIDTDVSDHPNFAVSQTMDSIEEFVGRVAQRLISQIDSKEDFYEGHKEKIIFAISVHSLECWLLPLYRTYKKEKIVSCYDALKRESKAISVEKTYRKYDELSRPFLKHKKLMTIIPQNTSFDIFINALPDEANIL